MKQLNILLTCEDYLPHVGGAEVCVANLKNEFERKGHTVTVFTNTTKILSLEEEKSIVRISWRFSPVQLLRHWCVLWRLIGTADIIHCQYSFRLAALCSIIRFFRRTPMVLTQQGRGIVPEVNPKWHNALLFKLCQHLSMKGANILTSTSDEITDLTTAFVPRSKIIDISNGYDAQLFNPSVDVPVPPEWTSIPDTITRILTVRRLVPKNGIHILIQALALVREQNSNFQYCAIGDGRMRPFIESLIAKHELESHVTLLGAKSNDLTLPYYRHTDLILVPSSAEARSIACIEAMGMRKPLIVSKVGGLIDLMGRDERYGTLVDIYENEACNYGPPETLPREQLQRLADAILAYMQNPEPFYQKAAAALELVQSSYSWEVIAERYEEVYATLLPTS